MDDQSLPPMEQVFTDVPNARGVDQVELNRILCLAEGAAQRLDVQELARLRSRVDAIRSRHQSSFAVAALVCRVGNRIKGHQVAVNRTLKGMGL